MHLNTRSTIVLLLLAFSVSAFGCVESTEQTDELATIPQEIVLFSAKSGIDSTALSYGYSKADGWQLLRYADLQIATGFDDALQARPQELNFSGSTAHGRFSGSLTNSGSVRGQQYSVSFAGGTQAFHSFQGQIAGGASFGCSIYLICDIVESICDTYQGQLGAGNGQCREGVRECRNAVSNAIGSMTPKDEAMFCAVFDAFVSGDFDPSTFD